MNKYFPSISRRITEPIGLLLLVILFFLIAFALKNLSDYNSSKSERTELEKQTKYWENVVVQRPDYRDAYLQLAILEYRLGDKEEAKVYLEKVLILDPNFGEARNLEKELNK